MVARLSADFLGGRTELWHEWGRHQSSIDSQGFEIFVGKRGQVPPFIARGRFYPAEQRVDLIVRPHRSFFLGIGIVVLAALGYSVWVLFTAGSADKTVLETILAIWGCTLGSVAFFSIATWFGARSIVRHIRTRLSAIAA